MAVSGINIRKLLVGALKGEKLYSEPSAIENDAYQYAGFRHLLYQKGFTTEILASFQPSLHYFAEWWKQLAGESEGKDQKGIFPLFFFTINLFFASRVLPKYTHPS